MMKADNLRRFPSL